MTPVEILAFIFAVLVLVKVLLVMFNPQLRIRIAENLLQQSTLLMFIYTLGAALAGYYLLMDLTFVQIAAVMLFTTLLIGMASIPFGKELIHLVRQVMKNRVEYLQKSYFTLILWMCIAIYILYSFFK